MGEFAFEHFIQWFNFIIYNIHNLYYTIIDNSLIILIFGKEYILLGFFGYLLFRVLVILPS